ncbi:ABC transporter permease [Mesorhizobium sp. M7A.F.Ca.US.006.01.1.1]|uniref:ABC transporter permease n=1 Tax=Mesorhizobium sp. M7A.F.Ca.US.006.01.1.1 TaxID=2496707 RepID=UPI0013E2B915|nr:ABC transporter permease [Mesorhizobium sp. M7A.F.Ca.US.006.01.1.1]
MATVPARPFTLLLLPVVLVVAAPFIASLTLVTAFGFAGNGSKGFEVWVRFLTDPFSWTVISKTLWLAARVTFFCVLVGYPVAFALHQLRSPLLRGIAFTILFTPLLMSVIVRAYGWIVLLSNNGLVNSMFGLLGVGPFRLVLNEFGATIAMVHVMLPFAVLPLLSSINQMPSGGVEAARDLGARPIQVFLRVVFPLTLPGVLSAIEIVFALAASAFVTPSILGGGRVLTLPRLVYDNIGSLDWSLAAVQSLTLLGVTVAVLTGIRQFGRLFRHEGTHR